MSTDLALANAGDDNTPAILVNPNDDKMFAEVSTSGKYLPRIQLCGGNSNLAKEGKIGVANWAFVVSGDNFEDLGKEFDFLPLQWRPKAMELGESIVSVYKTQTELFKSIQARSDTPDSGCMYGPEYLVWVPSLKRFGTLFLSGKTARKAAPSIQQLLGNTNDPGYVGPKAATAKSEFIKTKKHAWHGPVFVKCSTPFEMPPEEDSIEEQRKFLAPPESEVEPTAEPTGRAR